MDIFRELKERGLIAQMTHEDKIQELLNGEPVSFYIGFDATADSLHVGHFLQLVVMKRLQMAGHKPIALIGGATTMIGDPTGKSDMRKVLTREQIDYNADCFREQMKKLLEFAPDKAIMVNNADWMLEFNYMDFLVKVGSHFSVNRMLTAECFKSRLEKGLTFIEFNYMLLQSYDFLHLYRSHKCKLQLGGDDQWSNIINGADLIRRVDSGDAYGMTFTLLTTSEGKKMGKTEKGAVWLDPNKTSPYEFFQYWRNIDDSDVIKCMKLLTFIPLDKISEYAGLTGSDINPVKEVLAFEITSMVHGVAAATDAMIAAKSVFSGSAAIENIPTTEIKDADFIEDKIGLLHLLVYSKLASSNSEARRLIQGGGVVINDIKIEDISYSLEPFKGSEIIIKKGKKTYHKVKHI